MTSLEKRVALLEVTQGNKDLKAMTDDELSAYILTLEKGAPRWWDSVLARVMRHPSAFKVVKDDPDHAGGEHAIV